MGLTQRTTALTESDTSLLASAELVQNIRIDLSSLILTRSIMLVHGAIPDYTWTVAKTHIESSMQYGSRISTWSYDESAILCGTPSVKENLDDVAQLLSNAVEKDHLEVFPRTIQE